MFLNVSMANVKDFFLLKTRQYPLIGSQFPVIQRDPSTLVTRIVDIFNMRVFSGTPIDTINLPEKSHHKILESQLSQLNFSALRNGLESHQIDVQTTELTTWLECLVRCVACDTSAWHARAYCLGADHPLSSPVI